MSEIVGKLGGTSTATAAATELSVEWAQRCDAVAVSAPGRLAGFDAEDQKGMKVTKLLERAFDQYDRRRDIDPEILDIVQGRYDENVRGLGMPHMYRWVDKIKPAVEQAVRKDKHAASMLGEQLEAQVWEGMGFKLLDPSEGPDNLLDDPDMWHEWLDTVFRSGELHVIPGNVTTRNGELVTFGPGGSDITGGLTAFGIDAELYLNLTDGSYQTADPEKIYEDQRIHLRRVDHLLYVETRELGRNGSGLVHPDAVVPLMRGQGIPTEVRSTFDPSQEPTLLDNDYARAESRRGEVVAMSLMDNVTIHEVHEAGMAGATGRLGVFGAALAVEGISIIDSKGDGADSQKYFIAGKYTVAGLLALQGAIRHGSVETMSGVDLITVVGYDIRRRSLGHSAHIRDLSGINLDEWQDKGHEVIPSRHSIRMSVDGGDGLAAFNRIHEGLFKE